jgi:hypothetical protein
MVLGSVLICIPRLTVIYPVLVVYPSLVCRCTTVHIRALKLRHVVVGVGVVYDHRSLAGIGTSPPSCDKNDSTDEQEHSATSASGYYYDIARTAG